MSNRFILIFLTLISISSLFSESNNNTLINTTLQQAENLIEKALQSGDSKEAENYYREAGNLYLKLSSQYGLRNGDLYYNAGNCFMQTKELGKAIFCYKHALIYLPFNKNLRSNLVYARSLTKDDIPGTATAWGGRRFVTRWSLLNIWIIIPVLVILSLLVWFILLVQKKKGIKNKLIHSPMFWLFIMVYIFILSMEITSLIQARKEGVIISEECIARKGDSTSYAPAFQTPLHQGTEFLSLDRRSGWLYIQLADGRECWVEEEKTWLLE